MIQLEASRAPAFGGLFRRVLSLDKLLDFWVEEERTDVHGMKTLAEDLNRRVRQIPELRGPIDDLTLLSRHRALLETLFIAIVPPALKGLSCAAIAPPVSWDFFHSTPRFEREILDANGQFRAEVLLDGLTWEYLSRLFANLAVLRHCYGIDLPFDKSVLLQVENEQSGLLQTYQLRAQFDMLRIQPIGPLHPLDEGLLERVQMDLTSFELWDALLPEHLFEFYGMTVYGATDVTEEVTRTQLTELLVEAEPLVDIERFSQIERLLRTFLKLPTLELAVIGIEGDTGFCMDGIDGLRHGLDPKSIDSLICQDLRSDLFCDRSVHYADLNQVERSSDFMECCYSEGARSFLLAPLRSQSTLLGALALTTTQPGELNALTELRLAPILGLFTQALQRTLADVTHRVQAVLKEKFTSIHPSVEWKFRAAALNYVRTKELNDVVFPEAYSLYAASDIRASSELRNHAIRNDLVRQIESARTVLERAEDRRQIDYLTSLIFRLDRLVEELGTGLRSGDEMRISRILEYEVEPLFASLEGFGDDIHSSVEGYRSAVCEDSGSLHKERRAYELAVDRLGVELTSILTEAQEQAQIVFPHLFTMYRTDGVEHSIYVGDSLAERRDFSPLYLKNLKLWQIGVVAKLAKASVALEAEMETPLKVAHLILAQNDPIALRYSQEEKKFNVDGAYNTRYEIIKKRIDKALVKGTDERVTQPGKISIFYSQPAEEREYRFFLEFLAARGELKHEVETLEVEDLQGVHGLNALRVEVSLDSPLQNQPLKKNQ